MIKRLICFLLGHRWRTRSALPMSDSAFQIAMWIQADYDVYRICDRCKACEGLGETYE